MNMGPLPVVRQPVELDMRVVLVEIRRIFYAGHQWRTAAVGLEDDDVLQAIVLSILERQRRRGAYDPRRGALRPWLRAVVRSVVSNQLARAEAAERSFGRVCQDEDLVVALDRLDTGRDEISAA